MTGNSATTADQRAALFELLLAREMGDAPAPDGIAPVPRDAPLPLSFPQQRLWFLHEMGVVGNAYTIPMNLHLRGRLDAGAMGRVLSEIVRRHEVLRTVFRSRDGEPIQAVLPPADIALPMTDLSSLPPGEHDAAVDDAVNAHNLRPFDLTQGPMLHAGLLRLGPTHHVLLLAVHHIAFDGWSVTRFIAELTTLYRAFRAGRATPLAPLAVQYADYAAWQRRTLDGAAARPALDYWRDRLADTVPVSLPTDRPRPSVLGFQGGSCRFSLPPEVLGPLERLGRERGATLFMVLLAGFGALLHRYSGETRIAIGSPVAGRDRVEVEPLLGFFVNSVVMAIDLEGDPDFAGLLDRVRTMALDAFAHADIPFEKLVEELQPERGLDRNPLFQVMFALQQQETMAPDLAFEGLAATPIPFGQITARFDLELHVWPTDGRLEGICTYNLDLFGAATVERMLAHLATLLRAIAQDARQPVSRLPLLTPAEIAGLTTPDPATPPPPTLCLHQMLAEAVRRHPDALALVFGDTRLSLGELDRRANRIAHLLRTHGAGPETVVSLCFDRSDTMIAAFLGVFKAGAGYLPIDAAEPSARLAFILRDSRAALHLTQSSHSHLFADAGGTVLTLDTLQDALATQPDTDPKADVGPDHLAYVIYTSGSTGQPKGVEGRHGTIANLVDWHLRAHRHPPLRTLQYAQCSFDIFFQELFTSWLTGAACYMVTEAIRQDMEALAGFILEHRLERIFMPFTPLQYVIEILSREPHIPHLLEVTTAGEQLQATPIVRDFFVRNPQVRLHNHYGPTECYVVTAHSLPADPATWPDLPPVGKPVDNAQVTIVDQHMVPLPPGIPGEIVIGGAQVSRGYRSRPAQTAAAFVADPFRAGGARLYRTGDLGRRGADGTIEFLGRMDRQIKMRGFRIEPGEVEVALTRHPEVKQALVTTHAYGPLDTRLIAYVVRQPGTVPREATLRSFLQASLPKQMIPAAMIVLDALPLNVSGKIDRQSLPAPQEAASAEPDRAEIVARSPREQAVAEIFADLLQRDAIDPHDNFFELGGHSLLAARVVARLRSTLGLDVPLVKLFENPTVAGIVTWAGRQEGGEAATGRIPALGASHVPASFAQRRLWLLDQMGTTGAAYLMPVNLMLNGVLDVAALERSLQAILHRHAALRTTVEIRDGMPMQRIAPPSAFGLPQLDLSELAPAAQAARLDDEIATANTTGFDLATEPPFRARLVRLGRDRHLLLANFHHIACDGWSVTVFFRELGALYEAFVAGLPDPLPPLPIQYADYSAWQLARLTPDAIARHMEYWRPLLTGLMPLRLPADRQRPPIESFRGTGVRFAVPPAVAEGLRRLGRESDCTLYMVLLAAYMALLHRFTGDERITVGTPVANRDREEIEDLIGFFVNSLVMTAEVRRDEDFRTLLGTVRQRVLGAFAHQDLPFETLVEALSPVRDLSRNPLFQVVFALQQPEAMAARLQLPGLDVQPLDRGEATVRFDLEFHLWPQDGGLQGLAAYDRDLFDRETIDALIASYQALLHAIAEDAGRTISRLPLPAPLPRAALRPPPVRSATLHRRFAAVAAARPDGIAITSGSETLSYAALDARSNRLAHHLRRHGLRRGGHVALLMQRGPDLAMAMLAVMKAGGTYVPLDPTQPAERIRFVLDDTAATVVLTDAATAAGAAEHGNARLVPIDGPDSDWHHSSADPTDIAVDPAEIAVDPAEIAYVIYTSGSTGRPKGVQVSHASVDRLLTATQPLFGFGPTDVWTCFHSAAFDFSVWEIWGALLHGGRLVMVPQAVARTPDAFLDLLARERVTMLNQTPSAFMPLSELALARTDPLALRWIVFGGEALDTRLLRRWFDRFGDDSPRLVNCYGITETTVHVTLRPLCRADLALPFGSPIGAPIDDLALHLLDDNLDPVPDRVAGELCVTGPGLAQGYLNSPALTAARFVPDPFGPPGGRMYRSGDHARRRGDDIEYLGRIDNQVKLRGYRIETGEIAVRLRIHPAVADAAVVLRRTGADDPQLCAYLVPASTRGGGHADLQAAQSDDWQRTFDQQLERDWDGGDPLFRLTGWLSSYDRQPIPAEQMAAWADGTVDQIRALAPRHVLEIGCGTGILLFRLAEQVETYHGIDFSAASLAHVRAQIAAHAPRFGNVTLQQRSAQELSGLPEGRYDTIVVNSVIQYFAGEQALLDMLRGALPLLRPGGTIYLGDIRDLRLVEIFHASVAQARMPAADPAALLRQARQDVAAERELLIDPAWFTGVRAALPEIGAAALLSQRGAVPNELNKYRYAAVLRREAPSDAEVDRGAPSSDHTGLGTLASGAPLTRRFEGLANGLLADDIRLHRTLLGDPSPVPSGTTPEALHRLAGQHRYRVAVSPNPVDPGCIDACFTPPGITALPWVATSADRPARILTSDPTAHQNLVETIPAIRRDLAAWLPSYMIPTHFVVLDRLPLTGNGKLDTRALPEPVSITATRDTPYDPPETSSERALAQVFTELLGSGHYGRDDDFFALGGHSLLATRLCSRIRQHFGIEMPLIRIFEYPTLRGLGMQIDATLLAHAGNDSGGDDADRTEGEI